MDKFVTVATFAYPSEVAIIRGRLESEGIECDVKDELTVQTHNFISNAVGGIKLQVKESDVQRATDLLKEIGYLKEEELQVPKFWTTLDKLTSKIPLINKTRLEVRFLLLLAIVTIIGLGILYITTKPTTLDRLTLSKRSTWSSWCVDNITYDGVKYKPNSLGFNFTLEGACNEKIQIIENGTVYFPGFNTYPIYGKWKLKDEKLVVNNADNFQHIFNGNYTIDFNGNKLTLTSPKTIIQCYKTQH